MFKLDLTKEDVDNIKSKVYLSDIQLRILEYRLKDLSITQMSLIENCSESTINREIRKLKNKLLKVL